MATRKQLQELAILRLQESEALFAADLFDGCVYLCGYVVELALKACICARLDVAEYPDKGLAWRKTTFRTHNFDNLRLLAGLEQEISLNNQALFKNWSVATEWRPERRYEPKGTRDEMAARRVLNAIKAKPDGVLECLSRHW